MCGGLTLILTWKPRSKAVLNAKSIRNLQTRRLCILGIGLILPGPDYILTFFAGPYLGGKTFLVLVDAYSKWLEIMESKITSEAAICCLQSVFATHGLPEIIVSDNGPTFISELFAAFLSQNGIHHNKSAPYHPASNGLAERAVQSFN